MGILDGHMREVLAGSAAAFAVRVLGAGCAFVFQVLLARELGAHGVGIFVTALMITTVASVLGRAGMDTALVRFIAAGVSRDDWSTVSGVFRVSLRVALITGMAATLIQALIGPALAQYVLFSSDAAATVRWMALAVLPMALISILGGALRGMKRVSDSHLLQSVAMNVLSVTMLLVLFHFGSGIPERAAWAWALAQVLTVGVGLALWRRATPALRGLHGFFDKGRLLETSRPLLWVASMDLVNAWVAIAVLVAFRTPEEVGVYNVALRTAMLTSFVLVAFGGIVSPKFAAFFEKKDRVNLSRVAVYSTRIMTLLALPVLLLLVLFPARVLGLFGQGFGGGATALAILSFGQFVNVAIGPVTQLLAMTGNERTLRKVTVVSLSANVVLCIVLVPVAGTIGAATATAITWILMGVLALIAAHRRLGVVTHVLARPL